MAKITTLPVVSTAFGAVAAAWGLVHKTKSIAMQNAEDSGAFKAIGDERLARLKELYDQPAEQIVDVSKPYPPYHEEFKEKVTQTNRDYTNKRSAIAQKMNIDTFSGAWSSLCATEKGKALGFSLLSGVSVGAITYAIGKSACKSSGDGTSYGGDGGGGYSDLMHDGGGSHGFGFDGGFGGFGGDGGGFGF